jgi:cytoskeletal protein CcmA (bactofilin family)
LFKGRRVAGEGRGLHLPEVNERDGGRFGAGPPIPDETDSEIDPEPVGSDVVFSSPALNWLLVEDFPELRPVPSFASDPPSAGLGEPSGESCPPGGPFAPGAAEGPHRVADQGDLVPGLPEGPSEPKASGTIESYGDPVRGPLTSAGSLVVHGQVKGDITARGEVFVSAGSAVEADIRAEHISVGGQVKGDLWATGDVDLPPQGRLDGDIHARSITVHGAVHGRLRAEERVELGRGAEVSGDITCRALVIESGAVFRGRSVMVQRAMEGSAHGPQTAADSGAHFFEEEAAAMGQAIAGWWQKGEAR